MVAPAQADQQSSRDPAVPRPRPQPSYVYVDMAGRDYAADLVPFVCDRCRSKMARGYDGGGKYKALAVNTSGDVGWSSGHKSEQAARKSAVSYCSDRNGRVCEVFAVNGTIVWTHPAPVLPDRPWVRADDAGRPFDAAGLVTLKEQARATLAKKYGSAPNPKAIAVSSGGAWSYFTNGASEDEVMRQALEVCSHFGEEVCVIAALNDRLVNGGGAGEGAGSTAHAD